MSARESVWNLLRQWTVVASPPHVPERADAHPQWKPLDARDRAFAFDLATGVIRWRNLLDAVIASRLRQPIDHLDPAVRALLWLGAYQLLIQGGTADYAAVDTTVTLANKFSATKPAAGLVNAVLRGITRLQPRRKQVAEATVSRRAFPLDFSTEVGFAEDVFPSPETAATFHLAATRSHPAAYVEHLRRLYPKAAAELLLRNNQRPVITLRADGAAVFAVDSGLVAHGAAEGFYVAAAGWNETVAGCVMRGELSPQDPTAALPVRRAAAMVAAGTVTSPVHVLDLCAGLGTKTMQLARAFPGARVTAGDVDAEKLERLAKRAAELKLTNVHALLLGKETKHAQAYDVVLVDVPCSNSGVMGRRVQSRWRWPGLDHAGLHRLQAELLGQALRLVSPGGVVVYSTCSIDPAENQGVVAGSGARVVEERLTLPSLGGEAVHDGGYFAVLRGG